MGVYISVPFCRTKCTYCNFASDVISRMVFEGYVNQLCGEIQNTFETTAKMEVRTESMVDSIYLGGGTPTVLEPAQLERIFATVRSQFDVRADAEITVECAPGTLSTSMLDCLLRCGVNRVSLGVQSFVDEEARAVGRLHNREIVFDDIARLRSAGISNINIDLIAGLPHQAPQSWEFSLAETIRAGVPHVSVYMLEVDEESRLGRELIAGGTRYHAHFVPDEHAVADFYLAACERLEVSGIAQYEISNFAREGCESRHNSKYWRRQPYLGFGLDAHSMLLSTAPGIDAIRLARPDSLEDYMKGTSSLRASPVSQQAALEECFFLGLRLTRGVDLRNLAQTFGEAAISHARAAVGELVADGLMAQRGNLACLTAKGRLLSNEAFERFIMANKSQIE